MRDGDQHLVDEPGGHRVARVPHGRKVARRSCRASSAQSWSSIPPSLRQQGLELGQAAPPGRADASDRHAQLRGDARVVGPVVERHDAHQSLASRRRAVTHAHSRACSSSDDHRRLGGLLVRDPRLDHLLADRRRPGCPPWRPARPRGEPSWSARRRPPAARRSTRAGGPTSARSSGRHPRRARCPAHRRVRRARAPASGSARGRRALRGHPRASDGSAGPTPPRPRPRQTHRCVLHAHSSALSNPSHASSRRI